MKKKKYKLLLTDLDDTLIKSNLLYDKAMLHVTKYIAKTLSIDEKEFFNLVMDKSLIVQRSFPTVHTRHSRIIIFRMALEEMVGKYDLALLPELERMHWEYFLKNIRVYDGVFETLKKIRKAGIKIAIISDGGLGLRIQKTQSAGLLEYVDGVFASEEVIFEKPFGALFTLAMSKFDADPHETVMLGNNFKNDIRGAQLVGIRAGLFDPPLDGNPTGQDSVKRIIPDFVLNDFPQILEELGVN